MNKTIKKLRSKIDEYSLPEEMDSALVAAADLDCLLKAKDIIALYKKKPKEDDLKYLFDLLEEYEKRHPPSYGNYSLNLFTDFSGSLDQLDDTTVFYFSGKKNLIRKLKS